MPNHRPPLMPSRTGPAPDGPTNGPPPRALSEPKKMLLRQEQFCEHYVQHGNAARAAREAGYSSRNAAYTGLRLLRETRIRAHIHQLRQHHAVETVWEMEDLFDKLEVVYERALDTRHYHAAVRAIEVQARIKCNSISRLNQAAIRSLQQTPLPEGGHLRQEAEQVRRFLRPAPGRPTVLQDMSPEVPVESADQPKRR